MSLKSRAWLFWPTAIVTTLLVNVLFGVCRLCKCSSITIAKVNKLWGKWLLGGAGVSLTVGGWTPAITGPFMIVSNHSSMLDIPAAFVALNTDFRFASRPLFFKIPFLGSAMKMAGHFEINPKDKFGSMRTLFSSSVGGRFDGWQSVMIFPEGTRSQDGKLGVFHRGAFSAAIKHQVPVLPVRFWGLHRALPKGSLRPRSVLAAATIREPISTEGLKAKDATELAYRVRRCILDAKPPSDYEVTEKAVTESRI